MSQPQGRAYGVAIRPGMTSENKEATAINHTLQPLYISCLKNILYHIYLFYDIKVRKNERINNVYSQRVLSTFLFQDIKVRKNERINNV